MYKIGDKVIAISKTVGNRNMVGSKNLKRARNMNQKYLYITGIAINDIYYCDSHNITREDKEVFRDSDLVPYKKILEDE